MTDRNLAMMNIEGKTVGYGYMAVSIKQALERLGVTIHAHDYVRDRDAAMVPPSVLFVQLPGHALGRGTSQRSVLFSMFECTHLAPEFVEVITEYDTVVVPCEANATAFREHHDNVHVVPLGCDLDRWTYAARRQPTLARPFTFLCAGAGWYRKGFDIAVKAFRELRDSSTIPMRLIVKIQQAERMSRDLLALDGMPDDPDITYLKQTLTQAEEVALYAEANCFLAPSRGEGWGMCPHQAIAQGCPTILTDAAGHHEFSQYGIGVPWHHEHATYSIWEFHGQWWEPDYEPFLAAMRDVVDNYPEHCDRATLGAAGISHLTWENTARQLLEVLDVGPLIRSGPFYEFKRQVFPIQVTQHWECDVGGQKYTMEPGETYYDFADVKRIAYTAGVLHPDCPSIGLKRDQVEELSARIYHCPTCKRPFEGVEEFVARVLSEAAVGA